MMAEILHWYSQCCRWLAGMLCQCRCCLHTVSIRGPSSNVMGCSCTGNGSSLWGLEARRFAESLPSDVDLQDIKFILNPVLALCHFLGSLARLGLSEISIASPLRFEPCLEHLHRQLAAACKPLPQAILPVLVLKVFIGFVVKLLLILDKVYKLINLINNNVL